MSSKACTVDNVIGKLLSVRETKGLPIGFDVLDELDNGGKASLVNHQTEIKAAVLDDAGGDEALKSKEWKGGEETTQIAKGVISDQRNPSGLFGEDRVKPVIDFVTDHFQSNYDDIGAGKSQYKKGIKSVFDSIDTSDLTKAQQIAWDKYRRFYENGGELYSAQRGGLKTSIEKGVGNLTSNVIKTSDSVLIGNILEGTTKLPTLYGDTFIPAIAEAWQRGLFKKLPELERLGVYGHFQPEKTTGGPKGLKGLLTGWDGLIGTTDIPLKNISYFAGELADGDGLKAVQRVAFTPRFGDLPAQYYTEGGKSLVSLLSYTVNSYKMYLDIWRQAMKGNMRPLMTYHLMTGVIGAGAAAAAGEPGKGWFDGVPAPLLWIIGAVVPGGQEYINEHQGPIAKLIQPGYIASLGINASIATRQFGKLGKNLLTIQAYQQDGDYAGAALEAADLGFNFLPFGNSVLGDINIQKALRIGKEVVAGEIEPEDVPARIADQWPSTAGTAYQAIEMGR